MVDRSINGAVWKRARPEQELDEVALVRLQPVELRRRHRARDSGDRCARRRRGFGGTPGLQVIALHTSVGPIASSIFASGHSTTVTNGNMYSFCRDRRRRATRSARRSAADSRRVPALTMPRPFAVLRGDVGDARRLQVGVDRLRDGVGHARDRERREARVGMIGRQRPDGGETLRQRVGDLARVAARPDAGAVDAAAAAVEEHAVDHHVEKLLPPIDLIVAEQNLREARDRAPARADCRGSDRRSACRRKSGCGRSCRAPPRRRRRRPDRPRSPRAGCRPGRTPRPCDTASTAPAGPA